LAMLSTLAGYLIELKRSRIHFVFHTIGSALMFVLWLLAGIFESPIYYLFAFGALAAIGYMVFGFVNWGAIFRRQNRKKRQ